MVQMANTTQSNKTLLGKRILVCGKGGSGKSTVVASMAAILDQKDYEVMVLDADSSNPEGLIRPLFGLGAEGEPKPLIEFFGGIGAVACPVDDPSPLTRINNPNPVPQKRIDLPGEIPAEYYLRKGGTTLTPASSPLSRSTRCIHRFAHQRRGSMFPGPQQLGM
jgi:CO dehydrogenase maturation factor